MSQEDKGSGSNLPVASIVALLLFASGLWVKHEPLQTDRPGVELKQQKDESVHQDVEARLWQDPLEAVKRAEAEAQKAASAGKVPPPDKRKWLDPTQFKDWVGKGKGQRLVLPVLVFGGPYAEDAEQRRRTRYAVLSGLREAGFEPDNSRNIGYIRYGKKEMLIPFEKWTRRGSPKTLWDEVYVLWVAEEGLGTKPVARLTELLNGIIPTTKNAGKAVAIRVLGPGSYRMAWDLANPAPPKDENRPLAVAAEDSLELKEHTVRFVAPHLSFTADYLAREMLPSRMDESAEKRKQARKEKADTLERPLAALRLGPDDNQLARALIVELSNRGVKLPGKDPKLCNDQVALVVEADTHYARGLQRALSLALEPCKDTFRPMVFHYFRGLDGKIAQDDAQERKQGDNQRDKSRQESTPYQERVYGQGQFDYLRRIATEMRLRSDRQQEAVQESEDAEPGQGRRSDKSVGERTTAQSRGSVRAVIIVGSDIHDKLAILHALRENLPQALFATTDLDAAYFYKEQLRWARNLVVASSFDLTLPPALQKGAPPFRDNGQAATFLATRKLLADPKAKVNEEFLAAYAAVRGQVHLFEIGNQRAVPLNPVRSEGTPTAIAVRDDGNGTGRFWEALRAMTLVLVLLGLAVSWCMRQLLVDLWQRRRPAVISVSAGIVAVLYTMAVAWIVGHIATQPGEEPLSWADGVSAWPGALIRSLASFLALAFFFRGVERLRKGELHIERDFFNRDNKGEQDESKKNKSAQTDGATPSHAWSLKDFQEGWFPAADGDEPPGASRADTIWRRYQEWGKGGHCCARVLMGLVAVMGLTVVMLHYLGVPAPPLRGSVSNSMYYFLVSPSFILTVALLVWTLDRVALCSLFLRRLYGVQGEPKCSDWSERTLERFCGCSKSGNSPDKSNNSPEQPSPPPATSSPSSEQPVPGSPAPSDDYAEAVHSYIDMRMSARLSGHVNGIIAFPFVLCLLLIVSRSRYFDDWDMTVGYLGVIAMMLSLVAFGAATLRYNAERIRRYTVDRFEALEVRLKARRQDEQAQISPEQVAFMRGIAGSLKEGAFAPLSSQPIVRAILLPFGGAGLVNLLDFLLV